MHFERSHANRIAGGLARRVCMPAAARARSRRVRRLPSAPVSPRAGPLLRSSGALPRNTERTSGRPAYLPRRRASRAQPLAQRGGSRLIIKSAGQLTQLEAARAQCMHARAHACVPELRAPALPEAARSRVHRARVCGLECGLFVCQRGQSRGANRALGTAATPHRRKQGRAASLSLPLRPRHAVPWLPRTRSRRRRRLSAALSPLPPLSAAGRRRTRPRRQVCTL